MGFSHVDIYAGILWLHAILLLSSVHLKTEMKGDGLNHGQSSLDGRRILR